MTNNEKRNIYNAIQNLYNMDFTTWQEVLSMLYNLVADVEQKFEKLETKFTLMLDKEVTEAIKKMHESGELAEIINQEIFSDLNTKIDEIKDSIVNALTEIVRVDKEIEKVNEQMNTNTNDINLLKDNKTNYIDKLNIITPEMYGAKADGITDDTEAIKNCINDAIENEKTVFFTQNKTYCATSIIINKPCSINFNGAILKNILNDLTTPFLVIGDKNYSFDEKTNYSNKYNISNISVDMDSKVRQYAVALYVRHFSLNRIYLRNCNGDGVYCGTNDGIWINEILAFGNKSDIDTTASGVIIDANDIILGNVECAYFKNGVKVIANLNDIEIDKLHVWSDANESCCIKYTGTTFYGHINGLIIDCVKYGIDTSSVDGYGKMKIDNIMVFPSTNFPNWKVCKPSFNQQTMGITIGGIYGILDSDTNLRLENFYGIIESLPNYNQKPKIYAEYSNMSGSGHFFEQINGFLYQSEYAQITISESTNRVDLGFTIGINKLWDKLTVPVVILGSDYNPISANACMIITKDNGFSLRLSQNLTGTYRIKIGCPLPIGYYY